LTNNSQKQVFKGGWEELENAVFTDNKTTPVNSNTKTFFMKPDGSGFFLLDSDLDVIDFYLLSIPYDISSRSNIISSFSIFDDEPISFGLYFKSDGTKMFVLGTTSKKLFAYNIPIPWDITSIVDSPISITLSGVAGFNTFHVVFSRDGDYFFILDATSVYRFPLSIPWDITSNTSSTLFTPGSMVPISVSFKPEGDKMFIGDTNNFMIMEYDLSTPWDITTAVEIDSITLPNTIDPLDIFFRSNGRELFVTSEISSTITKFHLDISWSISSASHFENAFALTIPSGFTRAISWKPDGTKFMVVITATDPDVIDEYTVPNRWNTTGATKTASFIIEAIETNPSGMWWKPDGTRCYIIGADSDVITQLNISTPWDVSTMSDPSISFDLNAVIPALDNSHGIYFRADGKKLYVVHFNTPSIVYEFDLSTPWDISTLVDSGNSININATGRGAGIFFSSDGRNMYYPTTDGDRVVRYKLSIPWDTSSAVFADFRITSTEGEISPQGLFMRQDDGKKYYIVGFSMMNVITYDMSEEFNFGIIDNFGNELIDNLGDLLVYQ